ncbi:VOC family protein [Paenarthrobacter nitroguajacolicus]|uniref:VOC family protein n=1 Tax=Paenarthrobacter nitroguajacolicus TaxID=211146 RepID=UPI003D24638B
MTTTTTEAAAPVQRVRPVGPPAFPHFSHVHLNTPDLEASVDFFVNVLGLYETERDEKNVYLRCWGEWAHHSVILSQAAQPGLVRAGFLVEHPSHLKGYAEQLRKDGIEVTEVSAGEVRGQGDSIRFKGVGGQEYELATKIDRISRPANHSRVMDRPLPYPGNSGATPRRLHHINILVPSVAETRQWAQDALGMKNTLVVRGADGFEPICTLTSTVDLHEIAVSFDPFSSEGRLHHIALWYDGMGDIVSAAEILAEHGVKAEAGLGKHGGGENWFYYVREPGGNRIELFAGGYQVLDLDPTIPDVTVWDLDQADDALVWIGQPMTPNFLTDGTPHVEHASQDEPDAEHLTRIM